MDLESSLIASALDVFNAHFNKGPRLAAFNSHMKAHFDFNFNELHNLKKQCVRSLDGFDPNLVDHYMKILSKNPNLWNEPWPVILSVLVNGKLLRILLAGGNQIAAAKLLGMESVPAYLVFAPNDIVKIDL